MNTKQSSSPILAAIHETAEGLHDAGVMDQETLRKFDEACLTPVRTLTAEETRTIRQREEAFALPSKRAENESTGFSGSE